MGDKVIYANMCELEGSAHINLSIDIDDIKNYNVDFKLKLLSEVSDNNCLIQLKESLVHDIPTEKT